MEERPQLYIISIAHTYADMGSLRDKIPVDEQYEVKVTQHWLEIFRYLNSLCPELLAGLQVYQDGLVNASREIVDKIVVETQTANYKILRWLKGKGATIFGTEDASLLMEEYQALQAIANCPNGEVRTAAHLEYLKKSSWLLEERDNYIAQRIRETLPRGKQACCLSAPPMMLARFCVMKSGCPRQRWSVAPCQRYYEPFMA